MKDIMKAIKTRRSYYNIEKDSYVSDDEILQAVRTVVKNSPSGYNMQSGKVVILFGKHHDKLWSIVMETLRKIVPPEKFGPTEAKVNGFAAGYASLLFFDDTAIVEKAADAMPKYADNFRLWAQHGMGIIQGNLWNVLETMGFGASLQHYNPIIDDEVKKTWDIPDSWELIAQMPFGVPTTEPEDKTFLPIDERVKYFRSKR